MTWGQLRFQLLQSTPGVSFDLIDTWLNTRYGQVLEAGNWTGIRARSALQTLASYQSTTDTVTLTVGATAVVGVGTAFSGATVGRKFFRPGDTAIYTVTAQADATHVTIDRPYDGRGVDAAGTVYAGSSYVLMQNVYSLPADCKAVERILDADHEIPLNHLTPGELDDTAGPRTFVGNPELFAELEDTTEVIGGAAPLHQVELYPPPRLARGFIVEYLRDAYQFNGLNLAQSPLPFVSDAILLYGTRADIAVFQGKLPQAAAYEAKFQEELIRLLRVEHSQRRALPTLRMASRFTRHRLERAIRGVRRHF